MPSMTLAVVVSSGMVRWSMFLQTKGGTEPENRYNSKARHGMYYSCSYQTKQAFFWCFCLWGSSISAVGACMVDSGNWIILFWQTDHVWNCRWKCSHHPIKLDNLLLFFRIHLLSTQIRNHQLRSFMLSLISVIHSGMLYYFDYYFVYKATMM